MSNYNLISQKAESIQNEVDNFERDKAEAKQLEEQLRILEDQKKN